MELKESYLKTLDKVLTFLSQSNIEREKDSTERLTAISGDYWESVKHYLKDHNIAHFASGRLWSINKENLERSLTDLRIEIDGYKQRRKGKRNDILLKFAILILDAVLSFVAGWILRGCNSV